MSKYFFGVYRPAGLSWRPQAAGWSLSAPLVLQPPWPGGPGRTFFSCKGQRRRELLETSTASYALGSEGILSLHLITPSSPTGLNQGHGPAQSQGHSPFVKRTEKLHSKRCAPGER